MRYRVIFVILAFLASVLTVGVIANELPLTEQAKECCQKSQKAQADDATTNCKCSKCPYAKDQDKPCNKAKCANCPYAKDQDKPCDKAKCANCPHAKDMDKPCDKAKNCAGCKNKSAEQHKNCPRAKAAADAAAAPSVFDAAQPVGTPATCPVMNKAFEIGEDSPHSEVDGKYVYFCCPGCKPQFDAAPEKYLNKE